MNETLTGGVLFDEVADEHATELPRGLLSVESELDREFEARLAESSTLAFRIAYSVLRHVQDAEDVAQEAFAKAHRNFRQLRDRDRFRAWLVRMTWRLALDRRRADLRRRLRDTQNAPWLPTAMDHRRYDEIWEAIDALPEKLRKAIVLANVEGYDNGEVARLLNVPEGTVRSRLFLARKRLKEQLTWMSNHRTTK